MADLVSRLKRDRGLKGITTTVSASELDTEVPSKEAMLDHLRKQPKAKHSVRGLMQALTGHDYPRSCRQEVQPRLLAAPCPPRRRRADLASEAKGKWRSAKQGKGTFYSLE